MLNGLTPQKTALVIGLVALATIAGAWVFEYAGYLPCELCLKQRWAYYGIIPFSLALAWFNPPWIRQALVVAGLVMLGSAIFGVYHSGIEWKWWPGPGTCSGGSLADALPDLSAPAVMCNEAAIRIFGLSLAGWNAVISAALALLALRAAKAHE